MWILPLFWIILFLGSSHFRSQPKARVYIPILLTHVFSLLCSSSHKIVKGILSLLASFIRLAISLRQKLPNNWDHIFRHWSPPGYQISNSHYFFKFLLPFSKIFTQFSKYPHWKSWSIVHHYSCILKWFAVFINFQHWTWITYTTRPWKVLFICFQIACELLYTSKYKIYFCSFLGSDHVFHI